MIEIDISTVDPLQHEAKIFFGMTSRQCLCIVPSIILGGLAFKLGYKLSLDLGIILCIICVIPGVLFGWYKPYNLKFEDYIKLLYYNTYVSEPKRIYKTDNAEVTNTIKESRLPEKNNKKKKDKEKNKNKEKKKK